MFARASHSSAAVLAGLAMGRMILGAATPSLAQGVAQAAASYNIAGFRSAKFGMSQAEVRAAAARDFGDVAFIANANPAEGTQALQLNLNHLDPGPGPAQITYIFGARSHTLAHINVVWTTGPEPTAEQRAAMLTGAIQLAHYFQTLPTPLKASLDARPTGPNGLMLFAGLDQKGAGVEVAAEGVGYSITSKTDGAKAASPEPRGPALLRVSYIRSVANPDIIKISPGSF